MSAENLCFNKFGYEWEKRNKVVAGEDEVQGDFLHRWERPEEKRKILKIQETISARMGSRTHRQEQEYHLQLKQREGKMDEYNCIFSGSKFKKVTMVGA